MLSKDRINGFQYWRGWLITQTAPNVHMLRWKICAGDLTYTCLYLSEWECVICGRRRLLHDYHAKKQISMTLMSISAAFLRANTHNWLKIIAQVSTAQAQYLPQLILAIWFVTTHIILSRKPACFRDRIRINLNVCIIKFCTNNSKVCTCFFTPVNVVIISLFWQDMWLLSSTDNYRCIIFFITSWIITRGACDSRQYEWPAYIFAPGVSEKTSEQHRHWFSWYPGTTLV